MRTKWMNNQGQTIKRQKKKRKKKCFVCCWLHQIAPNMFDLFYFRYLCTNFVVYFSEIYSLLITSDFIQFILFCCFFFSPRTTPSHTNLYDINQLNLLMFDLGFDFFTNVLFTNFNQFHHILLIILNPNVQVYVELFTFGAHFIGLYWIWFVYIPWFINTTTQRFALTHI